MSNESTKRNEADIRKHEFDHYKHCPDLVNSVNYKRNSSGRIIFGSVSVNTPKTSYDAERLLKAARAVSSPSKQDIAYIEHLEQKLRLLRQSKR